MKSPPGLDDVGQGYDDRGGEHRVLNSGKRIEIKEEILTVKLLPQIDLSKIGTNTKYLVSE